MRLSKRWQLRLSYLSSSGRYAQSKCAWPWPWPLEWVKVKCKYTKRKATPTCDLLCWQLQCLLCYCLRDIRSRNVYDLDFNLKNWPRSNVNMPIERQHANFYVLVLLYLSPFRDNYHIRDLRRIRRTIRLYHCIHHRNLSCSFATRLLFQAYQF